MLDCTIRDGGLMNEHMFSDKVVKAVYDTCLQAGIDYMEIGYKNSKRLFAQDKSGCWKFCRTAGRSTRRVMTSSKNPQAAVVKAGPTSMGKERSCLIGSCAVKNAAGGMASMSAS